MNGAELLINTLTTLGVDTVFGYPGGAVLPIYDALRAKNGSIRHFLSSHEQGAAHAADGYARASGKTGVVLATSGPGATNLVTGIAAAYMDSSPLLAITGNVPLSSIGSDSFQEIDITGVTMPITKHGYIVKDARDIPQIVREGYLLTSSGRPGPVLIDIPRDIAEENVTEPAGETSVNIKERLSAIPDDGLADYILSFKNPVIIAGGGVSGSDTGPLVETLANMLNAKIVTTMMGLSAIDARNPYFLGMTGIHGSVEANRAVKSAGLIIALGTRFNERVTVSEKAFAPNAEILQIDIDSSEINKNISVDRHLTGDLKKILPKLIQILKAKGITRSDLPVRAFLKVKIGGKCELTPRFALETLSAVREDGDIIVTDVGQHQLWVTRYYSFTSPRSLITSGGLGAMGFGMGAAVGAALARPGSRVILITGDGSFHMNIGELSTAVRYGLNITVIVMNNHSLGLVRQLQKYTLDNRLFSVDYAHKTDFSLLAAAMGARGYKAGTEDDFRAVLEEALGVEGPSVIDCDISPGEEALPMMSADGGTEYTEEGEVSL